ncbi:MAG: Gfo/Idh/MocA family oxidoreductase [Acidobacteria bacterium]|uniref:Gfo/Idh/MocA family oxidoreductase n=1 Tax=Candidatus Polarisedimenticola svalbardensis TaxID=2886004 RepID=A0A8J6Y0M0_9BACT|nr:Gfo/Idh/MocA family oxidoreductase [Candidatus Polarisedimenticola svalbardensis]
MEPLKIGIIGAGAIAQRNAREAVASGVARLAGVFDVNHKVARNMAKALSAPFYPTVESMLASPDVDTVLISVPHHLHRPLGVQAAQSGKHVMMEKPVANSLEEADAILDACKTNGVGLTVNYSFRFLPKIQKAKQLVEMGALGDITGIQILQHQYKDPGYWTGARSNSPDDWRASREKCGGGFLIMTTCHIIDYVHFITGLRTERIYSEYGTLCSPAEVEDIISIACKLENGAVGSLCASSIMRGVDQNEERISGTNGTMVLNEDGISLFSTRPVDGLKPGKVHRIKKFPDVSWTAEWVRDFATSLHEGREPAVSGRDAWDNLAFITSAYDSMEKGMAVQVPVLPSVTGAKER